LFRLLPLYPIKTSRQAKLASHPFAAFSFSFPLSFPFRFYLIFIHFICRPLRATLLSLFISRICPPAQGSFIRYRKQIFITIVSCHRNRKIGAVCHNLVLVFALCSELEYLIMSIPCAALKRSSLALPFLLPSSNELITITLRRAQSSYRRTKQRLRVKPDAAFGQGSQLRGGEIIHNPPSSAPSVYHTPTKFLPPNDLRRTLRQDISTESSEEQELPTVFRDTLEKKYHLSKADVEEIRRLRLSDPMTWSRWKLARRFQCSPIFIAMVCEVGQQKREIQRQVLQAVQSRWGPKRRMAREDRQLRKEAWGRDE